MKIDLSKVRVDSEIAKECVRLNKQRMNGELSQDDLDQRVALLAHKNKDIYYYKTAPVMSDKVSKDPATVSKHLEEVKRHQSNMSSNAMWLERWVKKLFDAGHVDEGDEMLEVLDSYPIEIGEWKREFFKTEKRTVGIKVTERDPIIKQAEELLGGKLTDEQKELEL